MRLFPKLRTLKTAAVAVTVAAGGWLALKVRISGLIHDEFDVAEAPSAP